MEMAALRNLVLVRFSFSNVFIYLAYSFPVLGYWSFLVFFGVPCNFLSDLHFLSTLFLVFFYALRVF